MALSLPFKRKEGVGQVQVDAVCVCVHVSVCDAGYHLYRLEIKQTNLLMSWLVYSGDGFDTREIQKS